MLLQGLKDAEDPLGQGLKAALLQLPKLEVGARPLHRGSSSYSGLSREETVAGIPSFLYYYLK